MSHKKYALYLAYGSNLNTRQMTFRCPDAVLCDVTMLRDYELVFRGSPQGAFATIEPHPGMNVPAAIWKVSKKDILSLDAYEGFPRQYRKETLECSASGRVIRPFIYIMNETVGPYNLPARTYLQTICDGYTELGFDLSYLCRALFSSCLRPSDTLNFNREEENI